MASALAKVEMTEVTLTLTGDEGRALYDVLCFTNPDAPTDEIFGALMNLYQDLPASKGDWHIEADNNAIVFRNN